MGQFLKHHPHFRGMVLALAGYLLFSLNDALRKYLIQEYDLFTILFWASLFGLVIMLCFSGYLGGLKQTLTTKKPGLHFLRSCVVVTNFALATYSFGHLPLVDAYTLIFVSPFIVALWSALFFKEHLSRSMILVVIIGFCGVLVALRPGFSSILPAHITALGVALFYSTSMMLNKYLGKTETKLSLAFFPAIGVMLVAVFVTGGVPEVPSLDRLWLFVVSGGWQIGGLLLMSLAFVLTPGGLLAPLHYSQIFWGLVIGILAFGDIPDVFTGLGAAIIVGAGLYLLHSEKNKSAVGQ